MSSNNGKLMGCWRNNGCLVIPGTDYLTEIMFCKVENPELYFQMPKYDYSKGYIGEKAPTF